MQVTNNTSTSAANTGTTSTQSSSNDLANKDVFLKLMIEQIKNQDPLNPTDGAQFMGQLAQFSQLEQLVAMRQDIQKMSTATTNMANAVDSIK
jgi:flagellar basal-body rod modification protein FlgD